MGAKLSRHIAKLMKYVPLNDLPLETVKKLGSAAERYDTVAELPDDLRALVIQAENKQLPPYLSEQLTQEQ